MSREVQRTDRIDRMNEVHITNRVAAMKAIKTDLVQPQIYAETSVFGSPNNGPAIGKAPLESGKAERGDYPKTTGKCYSTKVDARGRFIEV